MTIQKIIDIATDNIQSGKQNVPFFLSKRQHEEILNLAKKINTENESGLDNCVIHTAILENGLEKSKNLKIEEVFDICTKLRFEKSTEPRGPNGFVIAINTHNKIKELARIFSIKNNEAHFLAFFVGIKLMKV